MLLLFDFTTAAAGESQDPGLLDPATYADEEGLVDLADVRVPDSCPSRDMQEVTHYDISYDSFVTEKVEVCHYEPEESSTFWETSKGAQGIDGILATCPSLKTGSEYADQIYYGSYCTLSGTWTCSPTTAIICQKIGLLGWSCSTCTTIGTTLEIRGLKGSDTLGMQKGIFNPYGGVGVGQMTYFSANSLRNVRFKIYGCQDTDMLLGSINPDILVGGGYGDYIFGRQGEDAYGEGDLLCGDYAVNTATPTDCDPDFNDCVGGGGGSCDRSTWCGKHDDGYGADAIWGDWYESGATAQMDRIHAGPGDDSVCSDNGDASFACYDDEGEGDVVRGDSGCDTLYCGDGDDDVTSGEESTRDDTCATKNRIYGQDGNDSNIHGGDVVDWIWSGDGTDDPQGGYGNDVICTGSNDPTWDGDSPGGNEGNDQIFVVDQSDNGWANGGAGEDSVCWYTCSGCIEDQYYTFQGGGDGNDCCYQENNDDIVKDGTCEVGATCNCNMPNGFTCPSAYD